MELSIPARAGPASSQSVASTGTGATTENGHGTDSSSSMLGDSDREAVNQSQQDLLLHEYNRCAEKRGLQPLLFGQLGIGDNSDLSSQGSDRRNWFARTFGRSSGTSPRRSSRHSIGSRSDKSSKHKRSESLGEQILPQFVQSLQTAQVSHGSKSDTADTLKNHTLETLVRICGKSYLYLPNEHATRPLMLPTCFRAAAQYLVQNGPDARGIFRISGSMRVVNELYDYYCINVDEDAEDISATVRAPNLPFHIRCSVHDVASMFKRLLAGLPGGILGYLGLFAALVDILRLEEESDSSSSAGDASQDPMKARLIALAIGSVPSALQRELICAVFGLLSLIGSTAESQPAVPGPRTPGSTLPHSEKMGYAALGIIFGPLLIGGHLNSYYLPDSSNDSSFSSPRTTPQPETPSPRPKSEKQRKSMTSDRHAPSVLPSALDRIFLANDVAQMVITNWQEVVVQMRQMGVMRSASTREATEQQRQNSLTRVLRPTKSDTFAGLNLGATTAQASLGHDLNLRKARSASNNRQQTDLSSQSGPSETSHTTSTASQPSHNLPSQRPSDMTFEEFAARKKLRSRGSSMSMASESSYSAITPQPVRPLTPQLEDPFYVSDAKTTSTRLGVAKLTKQRRPSGGISMLFGDKSTLPSKSLPKIARKEVPSSGEGQTSQRKKSGTRSSPWNVSLSPIKNKDGAHKETKQSPAPQPLPTPITPKRTTRPSADAKACQSEPARRVGLGVTPQSKTAALIAKVINTRSQGSPEPAAPETPTKRPTLGDRLYGVGSRGVMTVERSLHRSGNFSDRLEKGPVRPPLLPLPFKETKQPAAAQRHVVVSAYNHSERSGTQSRGPRLGNVYAPESSDAASAPAPLPSLPGTKQEATGLAQSHSPPKVARVAAVPGITVEGSQGIGIAEAKSPAKGSSVKAMAALFDNTPWPCTPELIAAGQRPSSRSPLPSKGRPMTEYTLNTSAPKPAGLVTPTRPVSAYSRGARGAKSAQRNESPSQQPTPTERRRARLTKSEDRGAALAKAHQRATEENNKDAAHSAEQKHVVNFSRRKPSQPPLRGAGTKHPPESQGSPNPKAPARSALSTKHTAAPAIFQATGKSASPSLPSPTEENTAKKLQQALDSKIAECQSWQARAEAAEKKVAELELLLGQSGVRVRPGPGAIAAREEARQSWAWQDLLPEPTSVEVSEVKRSPVRGGRGLNEHKPSGGRMTPQLQKENRGVPERSPRRDGNRHTETDDGYASESSTTTVVVRGKLTSERLMPFCM